MFTSPISSSITKLRQLSACALCMLLITLAGSTARAQAVTDQNTADEVAANGATRNKPEKLEAFFRKKE